MSIQKINSNTLAEGAVLNSIASSVNFRNRIINGDMRIDQRNAGSSVTPSTTNTYVLDRWICGLTQASKFSVQQNAGSVTPPTGFTNYSGITSTSAYSVVSGDIFYYEQRIEAFNMADLAFGTAAAASVTLSFWVRSSLTGTFGGALRNHSNNRSYPFTYTISSANTWEQKAITIIGDTSGTWTAPSSNLAGLRVTFGLGSGSTYAGTAGAWATGEFYSATGAVSVVGTNGATFYITGVQLEAGSVATPFERRPFGTELQLCQRYFQLINGFSGLGVSSTSVIVGVSLPTPMRATPSSSATSALIVTDTGNSYTQSSPAASGITGNLYGGRISLSNFTGLTTFRPCTDNGNGGSIALSSEM